MRQKRNLSVAVTAAANDYDPVNTGFAWGSEVLEVMGRIFFAASKLTTHLKVGMAFLQ